MITIPTGTCLFCGERTSLTFADSELADRVADWIAHRFDRPHIQVAFPQLSAGVREQILNGSHDECFNAAFPEEDE